MEPGNPGVNLMEHAFAISHRNALWVDGVTRILAIESWLYLAVAIDELSYKVAGWSMSERIMEKGAINTIKQTVRREEPPSDGTPVFRDDQECQYASYSFQRCLECTESCNRYPGRTFRLTMQ